MSPNSSSLRVKRNAKIIVENTRMVRKLKNIVKVWAALSTVNMNDMQYVHGRTANGNSAYAIKDDLSPVLNAEKIMIEAAIVTFILHQSKIKLPIQ